MPTAEPTAQSQCWLAVSNWGSTNQCSYKKQELPGKLLLCIQEACMSMPAYVFTDIFYPAVASALWSLITEKSGNSHVELRDCPSSALGALHLQVLLHWRRRKNASGCSLSEVPAVVHEWWTCSAKLNFPWYSLGQSCRTRALKSSLAHLREYSGFSTDLSLTKLCESTVAVAATCIWYWFRESTYLILV